MKYLKLIFIFFISFSIYAQTDCNIKKGYAIEGYDVVAYFKNNKAIKGKNTNTHTYNNVKYKFSCKENLEFFKSNPKKYLPQFGGWCAYAMATKGEKVNMDPQVFEIRDDKLYLFYDSFFTHTYNYWIAEDPEKLKNDAKKNWEMIKLKK